MMQMKDRKKIISNIISMINILVYCTLVCLFVAFIAPIIPENKNILIAGWINIALVIFVNLYSLYSKYKSFKELRNIKDKIPEMDLNKENLLSQISIQGKFSIVFISLSLFLELLLPFSVGYISKSYFSCFCVALIYKLFIVKFNKDPKVSLKKIKKINKILKEVKDELNIKYKINIIPLEGVEASLGVENLHNNLYLGVELVYILSDEEIKAFFYALLSSMTDNNYKITRKVNNYLFFIDELSNRSFFQIEAGFTISLYQKSVTLLNIISSQNVTSILDGIKNSSYVKDYVNAKYKKSLYKIAKFYLSVNDFIKIDLDNYYLSLVKETINKISSNKWIHDLVRKEIRANNNPELTFSEVEEKLDYKVSQIEIKVNEGIKNDGKKMVDAFSFSLKKETKEFISNNYLLFKRAIDFQNYYENLKEKTFEKKVEYAFSNYVLGEYQKAKEICLELINEKNNCEIAYYLLGNIYLKVNSYECEGNLLYPYYKLDFFINSRHLLEKFYLNNGDKEKLLEHESDFSKAKQLDYLNKKDSKLLFSSDEAIKINVHDKVNSSLIEGLKANSNVSTLIMFDKYYDSHYKMFVLLLLKKDDDRMIKEIEDYFYLQQDIDLNIIQLEEKDKEIIHKFNDFIIFKR